MHILTAHQGDSITDSKFSVMRQTRHDNNITNVVVTHTTYNDEYIMMAKTTNVAKSFELYMDGNYSKFPKVV